MTNPRTVIALLLLAPLAAVADARFDALAAKAEKLDSLERFLSGYVGKCTDVYEKRTCEQNVAQVRRAAAGKTFSTRIADAAGIVKLQLQGENFLILLTPFVDGGGLALTHGEPRKLDGAGQPVIGLVPLRGTIPPGVMDMEFQSPFRVGAIELEVVFKVDKVWRLKRRGEPGDFEGVAARFLGFRLLDSRTGSEIAAKVL